MVMGRVAGDRTRRRSEPAISQTRIRVAGFIDSLRGADSDQSCRCRDASALRSGLNRLHSLKCPAETPTLVFPEQFSDAPSLAIFCKFTWRHDPLLLDAGSKQSPVRVIVQILAQ